MMIKIAIVDDDRNMLRVISDNIKRMHELENSVSIHEFLRAADVLEQLEGGMIFDIIISDIEMPDLQGLTFGERIRREYPEIILVFLTAYPHYAVKSYAINAHQYILKEEMEKRLPEVLLELSNQVRQKKMRYRNVSKGNEIKKIAYDDILYIRKLKGAKYIQYKTLYGEFQERISLEHILEELGAYGFLMIERGFIVNSRHIDSVKGRTILLENGEILTISRGKYAEVREKLHTCWREQI